MANNYKIGFFAWHQSAFGMAAKIRFQGRVTDHRNTHLIVKEATKKFDYSCLFIGEFRETVDLAGMAHCRKDDSEGQVIADDFL
jgi:hypothetical protein